MNGPTLVARLVTASALFVVSVVASAQALEFEGLRDTEQILNFYNGGVGSLGSGPGPNQGVSFASNAIVFNRNDSPGGTGNFRNNPSGVGVMSFLTGGGAFMNVPAGFTTGFSFFYASSQAGSIRVFSGLNGTGTLLATIPLAANNSGGLCAPGPLPVFFCNWSPTGVPFAGTAMSVDFGGTANQIGFDNITLSAAVPVGAVVAGPSIPIPTLGESGLMVLAALAALFGMIALRRARQRG
jgi:hypothetical protein